MALQSSKRLEDIQKLIDASEEAHKKLHINQRLFGPKLAVERYRKILNEKDHSPQEKLKAIYQVAMTLCVNPRFSNGTHDVHHKIKEIALGAEPVEGVLRARTGGKVG